MPNKASMRSFIVFIPGCINAVGMVLFIHIREEG